MLTIEDLQEKLCAEYEQKILSKIDDYTQLLDELRAQLVHKPEGFRYTCGDDWQTLAENERVIKNPREYYYLSDEEKRIIDYFFADIEKDYETILSVNDDGIGTCIVRRRSRKRKDYE